MIPYTLVNDRTGFVATMESPDVWHVHRRPMRNQTPEHVFTGTLDQVMSVLVSVIGYCPECGNVKPDWSYTKHTCPTCWNQGHNFRIVNSEADRLWRIELWHKHYQELNYPPGKVEKIPSWLNLNHPPKGWDVQEEVKMHLLSFVPFWKSYVFLGGRK